MSSRTASAGSADAKRCGEFADGGVDDVAALGRARRRVDLIERRQAQDALGVDRIRIAQPVLDVGHRQARRPRGARRRRRRARRGRDLFRVVQRARAAEVEVAAVDHRLPLRPGNGGEALDEARWNGRRAGNLGGAGEDHVARAEQLSKIVSRKPDAALGQVEAELLAHRAAEPGVGPAFRRPCSLDESPENHAIAFGQPRFERPEDAHPQPRPRRPPHDAVGKGGGKQLDVVGRRDGEDGGGFTDRKLIERLREPAAVRTSEGALATAVRRQRRQHLAVAGRHVAQRAAAPGRGLRAASAPQPGGKRDRRRPQARRRSKRYADRKRADRPLPCCGIS